MNRKRFPTYLSEFWKWLKEANLVFWLLLIIAIALAMAWMLGSEPSIRLTGLGLQILGMIFAIRGLLKIRAHFGQPHLSVLVIDWFKRIPRWKKTISLQTGTGRIDLLSGIAGIQVWTPDNPDDSIEKRVEGILTNLERMREEQNRHGQSILELKLKYKDFTKKYAEDSKDMEQRIQKGLETLHTSDILTSLLGLVWLTVGILMSTMSQELCRSFLLSSHQDEVILHCLHRLSFLFQ